MPRQLSRLRMRLEESFDTVTGVNLVGNVVISNRTPTAPVTIVRLSPGANGLVSTDTRR